jgi:hypothetical protein
VNVTLDNGILNVLGSDSGETIMVAKEGTRTNVYDNGNLVNGFSSTLVNSINVNARGGNDTVRIVNNANVFASNSYLDYLYNRHLPATIDGGSGNDWLYGSETHDTIYGGSGVDRIFGYGGNDRLNGGFDTDYVYGGFGNDTIDGSYGNDYLYGDAGNDTMFGSFGADYMRGGSGDDYISGSFDNDRLYGDDGNDTLTGSFGDDSLYGGNGNDKLYGSYGDDVLRGDAGNDLLYGDADNDTLYGGSGNDTLRGGSGNDGLFGGNGYDTLRGESGADRLVVWDALFTDMAYHQVLDAEPADAVVHFKDRWSSTNESLGSNIGWVRAYGDTWSAAEIEKVDVAFANLMDQTGNTRLLETSTGGSMTFERVGTVRNETRNADGSFTLGSVNTSVGGWNTGTSIIFTDNRMLSSTDEIHRVVYHELAHNWDEASENAFADQFRAVAGWFRFPWFNIQSYGYEQAVDGNWSDWWFVNRDSNLDGFARSYGKMNPLEDFATSFAAYMMSQTGRSYNNDTIRETPAQLESRLDARFDVLDDFFASLA